MAKTPLTVSGIVFLIVALLHFVRIVTHFEIVVGGWFVPLWVNGIGFAVAASLSYWTLKTAKKM